MRPGIRMDAATKSSAFKVKCPVQKDEPTVYAGNVKLTDNENKFPLTNLTTVFILKTL